LRLVRLFAANHCCIAHRPSAQHKPLHPRENVAHIKNYSYPTKASIPLQSQP
jgi:hypothetical protein